MSEDEELPEFMREPDALDMSSMAGDEVIRRGRDMAMRLAALDSLISSTEEKLGRMRNERTELSRRQIPEFFIGTLGTDHIGLPEVRADMVIVNYYHANIPVEWEESRREAGFRYIENRGDGDMIRVTVSVSFGRNEFAEAMETAQLLRGSRIGNTHEIRLEKSIPWNTLTAYVREQIEKKKTSLDLEVIGASIGREAKIKKRKD